MKINNMLCLFVAIVMIFCLFSACPKNSAARQENVNNVVPDVISSENNDVVSDITESSTEDGKEDGKPSKPEGDKKEPENDKNNTEDNIVSSGNSGGSQKEEIVKVTKLDSGKCGDTLNWELLSNGTLRIYGKGAMYDYFKYYEPSPWYKYRNEPILSDDGTQYMNPDGTVYNSVKSYNNDNPNGYKIKKIVIEEGVTHIGNWAFYRVCVDTLTIPEGVETIGAWAIRFSPSLKTVNLPDSLISIGDFGMSRNQVLKTVNFGDNLKQIGNGAFNNSAVEEIILPNSVTSIGEDMYEDYKGINESNLGVFDNCTYLKRVSLGRIDKIPQRAFLSCASLKSVVIPNTVSSIDEYAFYQCTSLKSVTFKAISMCTDISMLAFNGCTSLESVIGGSALKTIGSYSGLSSLKKFEFSEANTTLLNNQFYKVSLETASVGSNIRSIPSGWMGYNTSLKKVYISNSVTEILGSAFLNCTALNDIYYDGTLNEWRAISKTSGWSYLVPSTCIVHFSDGTTQKLMNCK